MTAASSRSAARRHLRPAASEFVADFIGQINLFRARRSPPPMAGEVRRRRDGARHARLHLPESDSRGQKLAVMIRPESLRVALDEQDAPGTVETNSLQGKLVEEVYLGELWSTWSRPMPAPNLCSHRAWKAHRHRRAVLCRSRPRIRSRSLPEHQKGVGTFE